MMKPAGIYIDFPFCIARCAFCAFNVQGYREPLAKRYAEALKKEIALYAQTAHNLEIVSLYLGGGTPTLYPPETLNEIVRACYDSFSVAANAEVTVEAHPATIHPASLHVLRSGGINRLSIGAQSFSDAHLERMGRHHTVQDLYCAFNAAREAGFDNISMDLIYALPDQSLDEWEKNIKTAIALNPEHLSIYGLSIEDGTLFYKQGVTLPSEEEQRAMYQLSQQRLLEASYIQYEISNFAKSGYASAHNLLYWNRGDVLGVGLSAHSYHTREHRANTDSLRVYLEQVEAGCFPIDVRNPITEEEERIDRILFGLRKTEGIPATWIHEFPERGETLSSFIKAGFLARRENRLALTSQGMLMADEIAVALL